MGSLIPARVLTVPRPVASYPPTDVSSGISGNTSLPKFIPYTLYPLLQKHLTGQRDVHSHATPGIYLTVVERNSPRLGDKIWECPGKEAM